MIMVEDDAPVTSSMKFKQMWIRSKDKKEQKKEARQEEENSEPKKKSRGLFGLMSRKEEELVEQEMESLKNENLDKEQLLEELFPILLMMPGIRQSLSCSKRAVTVRKLLRESHRI